VLVAGPIALNNITWKFYFVLIIPPTIEFICILLFFPETKVRHQKLPACPSTNYSQQRSLEDIAEIFGDKVAVHYYQSTAEEQAQYAEAELAMDEKAHSIEPNGQRTELEHAKQGA
jgi:hypothetical protein